MGNVILQQAISSKYLTTRGTEQFQIGSAEMQGFRLDMEDALTICVPLSEERPDISLVGVFDGHSGSKASHFLAENLHKRIAQLPDPLDVNALAQTILELDAVFLSQPSRRLAGSTCVFAMIRELGEDEVDPSKQNEETKKRSSASRTNTNTNTAPATTDEKEKVETEDSNNNPDLENKSSEAETSSDNTPTDTSAVPSNSPLVSSSSLSSSTNPSSPSETDSTTTTIDIDSETSAPPSSSDDAPSPQDQKHDSPSDTDETKNSINSSAIDLSLSSSPSDTEDEAASDDTWNNVPAWTRRLSTTIWAALPAQRKSTGISDSTELPPDIDPTEHIHTSRDLPPMDREWKSDPAKRRFEVTVLNVGDSRAVVVDSQGRVFPMTIDHKPNNPNEASRIMNAGGHVMYNRVDGELAMSRAFGDWPYKKAGHLSALDQKVISVPDVSRKIVYTNDQLLICCDGFFETLSTLQVGQYIHHHRSSDPAAVMAGLCQYSLDNGSKDNMSGVILYFKDGTHLPERKKYCWGPAGRNAQYMKAFINDAVKHGVPEAEAKTALEETGLCNIQ